ncbi:DUF2306 domain-containing protein [Cohnella hongkongensis]|uniref:DUF2306 domain-containing protein n=1 Tax=Cohnella hongkongensis TaxID=178337 RepID=A0ABV9F934_9BACL
MKSRTLYLLLVCVSTLFIVYSLVKNYVIDPEAAEFLSHKIGLKRELRLPVWLQVMYVHVAFACIAMAAGLLNFSSRLFEKSRKLHRMNGYVYLVSVLLVVLTSGYMAPYATGGKISSMGFNLLNLIWPFMTVMALVQIKKKRIIPHRNWMIRSYVFCFTNLVIHLITSVCHRVFGLAYAESYTIGVYGSIALLLAIPALVIRMLPTQTSS